MPRKTNDELNTDVNALAKQWTEFLKIAPTKADLNNLATKEDVKKVVQTELATFKEEMQQTLKEDVETRFSAFTKEQDVKTNNINTRVDELERKLENKLAEVDVKTVLQDMYTRRMNYLLLGAKEKEHGAATTLVGTPFLLTITQNTARLSSNMRARAVIYMECALFALLHQYALIIHICEFASILLHGP